MKRLSGSRTALLLGVGLAAAAAARAQQAPAPQGPPGPHWGHGMALRHMEKCLSTLGLSAAQQKSIDESLAAGKATLRADGEALRGSHQKMQADIAAGADTAVLGQNVLDQDAAHKKMKADAQAIHDQIRAQLSADQVQALDACASAPKAHHMGPGAAAPGTD